MFHKPFICMVCCLAFSNAKAQQSNLTVETIAANVFNTTVTPGSYESSNGLTYFMDKGTIANVSVTGVAGKAVWTDGTAVGTHSVNIPAIKEHLGIIDSAYYGVDELGQLFKFTSGSGITVLQERFQKACEFVKLGGDYYFLGVPTNDTLASIWKVNSQGVFSQMATVNGVNALTSFGPLVIKVNGQQIYTLVNGRLQRFETNIVSNIVLLTNIYITGFQIDNIGSNVYICAGGAIYQYSVVTQALLPLPGLPSNMNFISFKIFKNHLYLVESIRASVGQGGYSLTNYLLIHDGIRVVQGRFVLASGGARHGTGPNPYSINFKETTGGNLYMICGYPTLGQPSGALKVYVSKDPVSPITPISFPSEPLYSYVVNTNIEEYRGNIVFNSWHYFAGSSSFQYNSYDNGYFEIDSATNRVTPIGFFEPRMLKISQNNIFGISQNELQVLRDCPYANLRPQVSNVSIDTVTGMLRIRWEGPTDGSVRSYSVMSVNSERDIYSPLIQGARLDTILGVNGQSFYEYIGPMPAGQGVFSYALRANTVIGSCADTAVFVGSLRRCDNSPYPNASLIVTKLNDLNRAIINVSVAPLSSDIQDIFIMKNGRHFGNRYFPARGTFVEYDNNAQFSDVYSLSITSSSVCRGNWTVPTTTLDSFSCSSFNPTVTFNNVSLNRNIDGCPVLNVDYTIYSNQSTTASLSLGVNSISYFSTNLGTTHYQQSYPIWQNMSSVLSISTSRHSSCPDFNKAYPLTINPDSLFYKIDSVWVEQLPSSNEVIINWGTKNRALQNQIFEVYRNGEMIASNLVYSHQDSIFSFVDAFAVQGYTTYQINSLNYGTCNASANTTQIFLCFPTNPSQITELSVREIAANQRLISWKVEGGRTRQTLTKATIKLNTPIGVPQVLKPEIDITNNPLTDTYSAIFNCPDRYAYSVNVFATNPYSICTNDSETILCDCNTIAREDVSVVFPNPVRNNFTIYYPQGTIKAGVQLYDGVGALVREYGEQPNYCNLDMSGLPQGFYFLRLQYSNSFEMVKMEKF